MRGVRYSAMASAALSASETRSTEKTSRGCDAPCGDDAVLCATGVARERAEPRARNHAGHKRDANAVSDGRGSLGAEGAEIF
mgnify:CR=1 FL=1